MKTIISSVAQGGVAWKGVVTPLSFTPYVSDVFTTFDSTANSYMMSDTAVIKTGLTGNIKIKMKFTASARLVYQGLMNANTASGDLIWLAIKPDGKLRLQGSGVTGLTSGTRVVTDSKLHAVDIEINGSTKEFVVYLDGVSELSGILTTLTNVDRYLLLGSYAANSGTTPSDYFLNGIIKDVEILSGGPLNVAKFKLDSLTNNYDQDYTNSVGNNIIFNGVNQYVSHAKMYPLQVVYGMIVRIECYIRTTASGTQIAFGAASGVAGESIGIGTENGFVKVHTSGNYTPGIGTIRVDDGEWHRITGDISTVTGEYTAYVDDVLDYTDTHTDPIKLLGLFSVVIGAVQDIKTNPATNFFSGSVTNCVVSVESAISPAATVAFYCPVNDGWEKDPDIQQLVANYENTGSIVFNSADGTWFNYLAQVDPKYGDIAPDIIEARARAAEGIVKNGDFRDGTIDGWSPWSSAVVEYSDGKLRIDSSSGNGSNYTFASEIGEVYEATVTVAASSNVTAAKMTHYPNFPSGSGSSAKNLNVPGETKFEFTGSQVDPDLYISRVSGGRYLDIESVSIRKVSEQVAEGMLPPPGEFINSTESAWSRSDILEYFNIGPLLRQSLTLIPSGDWIDENGNIIIHRTLATGATPTPPLKGFNTWQTFNIYGE